MIQKVCKYCHYWNDDVFFKGEGWFGICNHMLTKANLKSITPIRFYEFFGCHNFSPKEYLKDDASEKFKKEYHSELK